jgi:hypothetical protein
VGEIKPLAEGFFPTVLAIGRGRVGGLFRALGILGIALVALRVYACRRRIEEPLDPGLHSQFQRVQIDRGGIVHHRGVVISSKKVPRAAHISRQLVNLVDVFHHPAHHRRIAQVSQHKLVGRQRRVLLLLQIGGAHPVALCLEPFD